MQYAQTGITGGGAVIEGSFTAERATDIAVQLRGGALPVPVEVVENRTVGATLGRDSIQSSIYAGIGGLLLVLVFMVVYYRLTGTRRRHCAADLCRADLCCVQSFGSHLDPSRHCWLYSQHWHGSRCQCADF